MSGIVLGDFHTTQTTCVLPETQQKLFLFVKFELACRKGIALGDPFKGRSWQRIIAHLLSARHDAKFQGLIFRSSVFCKMQRNNHRTSDECRSGSLGGGTSLPRGQGGLGGGVRGVTKQVSCI